MTERFDSVWDALGIPEPTDQEKIRYWMIKFKESNNDLWKLITVAKEALDAYEDRFESLGGRYCGPIDIEMKALQRVLNEPSNS